MTKTKAKRIPAKVMRRRRHGNRLEGRPPVTRVRRSVPRLVMRTWQAFKAKALTETASWTLLFLYVIDAYAAFIPTQVTYMDMFAVIIVQ